VRRENGDMRILSVDGGGYLGLATAAFIAETERHFGVMCHDRFDMFCGTSTGAIIALALASGMTGSEIVALYQSFGSQVFRNSIPGARALRIVRSFFVSRYSNHALKTALEGAFGDMALGDIKAKGKSVLITAFSVSTGKPRVFKTDHSSDLTRDDSYLVRDVALASAAAPVYLPLVPLRAPANGSEELYCDGGVFANHPALLGYAEAISHLSLEPDDVQILSLSTPRADLSERASARSVFQQYLLSRGLISWGTKLAGVMIDSTSMIAHETLRRLVSWRPESHSRYVRIMLDKPRGVDMDVATRSATDTLIQVGSEKAYSTEIRNQVAPFFQP
jgi:patatin-like phospholipase/acyl hydrolase